MYVGLDVVETGLKVLKNRLARLSSTSVLANTVTGFVAYYIGHWESYPSLLPVCLEYILARGASALQESDTSLGRYVDFFLDKCIETRQLGSAVALLAIPTTSAVIKEIVEKNLLMGGLDEVVVRLSRCLLDASQPEESISFRSAAAASLKATGRILVEMVNKQAETSRNLFLVILNLIQDEEKEVRADTAYFLTDLLYPLNSSLSSCSNPRLVQMSPSRCLEEFAGQIHRWFSPHHLIPVVFHLLKDSEPAKDEEIQALYEREPRNFFREETDTVRFLVKVVEALSTALTSDSSKPFELQVDVRQFVEDASQFVDRIHADPSYVNDTNEWLFTHSAETYSILMRLSARLTIIALCYPYWQRDQRFLELQSTIQLLNRQQAL